MATSLMVLYVYMGDLQVAKILQCFSVLLSVMFAFLLYYFDSSNAWIFENIAKEALIAVPALFVALLIPISVFLMERDDLYGFDKNVILDKIIFYKPTLSLTLIVALSLFVDSLRFLSTILCLALIGVAGMIVVRTYGWMTVYEFARRESYRQRMRLDFLEAASEQGKIDIWSRILNDKDLLEKNQSGLIAKFIKAVESVQDMHGAYHKTHLFALMSRNVDKIDFSGIEAYKQLVLLGISYFKQWRDAQKKRKEGDKTAVYPPHTQKDLALGLLRLGLESDSSLSYVYFDVIKNYVTSDHVDEADFIRSFFPSFISVLREGEYEIMDLWEQLPNWTVTQASFMDKETREKSVALINSYMSSVGQRARAGSVLSAREVEIIDYVTGQMLPNVDASFWFDILTLCNTAWGVEKGEDSIRGLIRSYASRRRSFGYSLVVSPQYWDDDKMRTEVQNKKLDYQAETIFLVSLIYTWLGNPVEIKKILNQIRIIEKQKLFEVGTYEAEKIAELRSHFEKIRDYNLQKA